ncbi:MAG: helix-turn-helix domain-containing protein [Candidatus Obscuribacterales bacterium]|nr:helix-turn-helix domain-containing protein [Candidatus Obscuribacterales bacterium]
MKKNKKESTELDENWFVKGHDNIFVDLGFPEDEANELSIHAFLSWAIQDAVKANGSTQKVIARKLGIDQPKVSKIRNGNTDEFSIGRLAAFLLDMGYDIHLGIAPKPDTNSRGRIEVIDMKKHRRQAKKRRAKSYA